MNLKMKLKTKRRTFAVAVLLIASAALTVLVASAALIGYGAASVVAAPSNPNHAKRPPACYQPPAPDPSQPPGPPPEMKPTTITTIKQAYYCILDNFYDGPVLNNRSLLTAAFAGLTLELQRRGFDQRHAMPPAFTGKVDDDMDAFSQVYQQITAQLPDDPALRQAIAEATMLAMIDSLNTNHVGWNRSLPPANLSGISLSGFQGVADLDPAASAPLYVEAVQDPAESAGVQAGDEIVAINGVPPYINGVLSEGAIKWITESKRNTPVNLTLRRPATDVTFDVSVTPGPPPPPKQDPPRLLDGNIAYVKLPGFAIEPIDDLLAGIAEMRKSTQLRGVIIDLRNNGGGSGPDRLLGALAHDKVFGYWCDAKGHCTENRTDDSVQLLNLPVVTLIDRGCASACDIFASGVKDLRLGALVGTRTAGVVAGPADPYQLEDGSSLRLPKFYQVSANREIINTIGVAPDHFAPVTAADLSAGRDPGLAKALELLKSHRP